MAPCDGGEEPGKRARGLLRVVTVIGLPATPGAHVVRAGEWLLGIARSELTVQLREVPTADQVRRAFDRLRSVNAVADPDTIRNGQRLAVPSLV